MAFPGSAIQSTITKYNSGHRVTNNHPVVFLLTNTSQEHPIRYVSCLHSVWKTYKKLEHSFTFLLNNVKPEANKGSLLHTNFGDLQRRPKTTMLARNLLCLVTTITGEWTVRISKSLVASTSSRYMFDYRVTVESEVSMEKAAQERMMNRCGTGLWYHPLQLQVISPITKHMHNEERRICGCVCCK